MEQTVWLKTKQTATAVPFSERHVKFSTMNTAKQPQKQISGAVAVLKRELEVTDLSCTIYPSVHNNLTLMFSSGWMDSLNTIKIYLLISVQTNVSRAQGMPFLTHLPSLSSTRQFPPQVVFIEYPMYFLGQSLQEEANCRSPVPLPQYTASPTNWPDFLFDLFLDLLINTPSPAREETIKRANAREITRLMSWPYRGERFDSVY